MVAEPEGARSPLREADVEGRGVAGAGLGRLEQQFVAAAGVDPVLRVLHPAGAALLRVGRLREDLRVERVVEEQLRGEIGDRAGGGRGAELEVDVRGAAP